ncbi:MAG: hypothetical protein GYA24_07365 [Candidatus Lokiarchaeota archaeon]|nr:hypothetical protein [Candidatus Lokiarchaeota archaeon]
MIYFLAIGACFTIVSIILTSAMVSSSPGVNPIASEPISSMILASIGYIGLITGWKETIITVDNLEQCFTTITRNLVTRKSTKHEARFSAIQTMRSNFDERANTVKVTIVQDNHEAINFQLDCNSYGPLEKYLKTLLPKIPIISRETWYHEAGMYPGHVSAVY